MLLSGLSIRHQLILIVAIIALPAICIIINSGVQQQRAAIHDAKLETQQLAETIVSEQNNLIASTRQLLIALSQLPEVSHRHAEAQSILTEILRLSPQYANIFIADSSGAVWASGIPSEMPVSVADTRYYRNALASGNLSSGGYDSAGDPGKSTLTFGYPLKDDADRVTAVICASLSLDYYRHIFEAYGLPRGASVALLDHEGIILARAVEPEKYVGKPANPEIFRYMLQGPDQETSIGPSSIIGDTRIQTYRKLTLDKESTPYMYVRAGIPEETVMSKSRRALLRNLTLYTLALAAASFLSWLIGKKCIIDRVVVLQRSSKRLADGDLDTRVAHEVAGGEIGALGQAFDDMAKKLASRDQALRESEKNYRGIFNTAHDALFVYDRSGRITEANKSSEKMFGYAREEFLYRSIEDLIPGEPPYSFSEALELTEGITQKFEWPSRGKNGQSFWTDIALTPTNVAGERQVLAVVRDITERKEMEKMRELMLSNVSHEMRTPLTAMLGFLEFVTDNEVKPEELKHYHMIMRREGVRLHEMINNFLDMQRLKARLHHHNFKPLDARSLVEEAVEIFANPSTKHSIKVEASPDLPPICGDDELLHRALNNLLSNAIKYSPEGSEVLLEAGSGGGRVTLSVKDRGIGIPPESMDKVFDVFYRVKGASSCQVTGTGLGLALVREVAEVHGGQVWVESKIGEGSTFYMSLPVTKAEGCGET